MRKISTIFGGFDLTFIDIDIQPYDLDTNELIQNIPVIGSHHRNTNIDFRPGGNGFNFCRALAHLGRDVTYVGPSSAFFEQIVKENEIPIEIFPIRNSDVSYTAILNRRNGETQFNSVRSFLSYEHLNEELVEKFKNSPIKSISNVSLNPTSIEWICSLLISLVNYNLVEEMKNQPSPLDALRDVQDTSFEGIIFIDPSDISHFSRVKEFSLFLELLKKFKGEKYLSVNENELKTLQTVFNKDPEELSKHLELPIIFHTSKEVRYYNKKMIKLPTLELKTMKTFVGAGDCFNGAFLHSLFNSSSEEDALKFAIKSATYLIETGDYPTA
ncbi:MAG: carbohydrate kinase family protein [Candidatus Heimdallarchaeota archaeon]|nr:carbohydrate kinase family protein [Candidatus Heimdallarchaeota archaeon]MCK4877135.1 carbohydrate kinase family protein [Candidatus Heimdallarchaeota archaeon]